MKTVWIVTFILLCPVVGCAIEARCRLCIEKWSYPLLFIGISLALLASWVMFASNHLFSSAELATGQGGKIAVIFLVVMLTLGSAWVSYCESRRTY